MLSKNTLRGFFVLLFILLIFIFNEAKAANVLQSGPELTQSWELIWSDEFNGPNGSQPDPKKWVMDDAHGESSNAEFEFYTSRPKNVFLQDGNLVIQTLREPFIDSNGQIWQYTSGRISSASRFEPTYGKFEARIKMPMSHGVWPAFWLLGANIDSVSWPDCGEIDIMENPGNAPSKNFGNIVGPSYYNGSGLGGTYTLPNSKNFADDFHVFAAEWDIDEIRFYVDDQLYSTINKKDIPKSGKWVFDHPFYMILNTAVGGYWPGEPDSTTLFPQKMLVDYVRVYQRVRPSK